jgi:hypothetical protein
MRNRKLRQIFEATPDVWDRPGFRPAIRENFRKVLDCGTSALGATVYASENEEKRCFGSCKSRACPSCGYRATLSWQQDQKALLPDIPYAGIVLTMPNVLWPIFKQNRHLLHDLPTIGADVIQQWVKARYGYGVRMLILVVQHTFGTDLKFNCHLHILVSAGGLRESDGGWISPIEFNNDALMHMWRYAVITLLREALRANVLRSTLDSRDLKRVLTTQYERWWNTYIDPLVSKAHFLDYVARYVRRLPISQRRLLEVSDRAVRFLIKDPGKKQLTPKSVSLREFVARLAQHVPDHYRHYIRYYGLLAPGLKSRTSAALFERLGQEKRPRPQRLSWRDSILESFKVDPLLDSQGQVMHKVRREKPTTR